LGEEANLRKTRAKEEASDHLKGDKRGERLKLMKFNK